ncbi:MAG: LssY C-terminal domain-containing protein [Planctomycetota bacterium]
MTVFGCARFNPRPIDKVQFQERALTQYEGNIRVTAAVPSAKETKKLFDVNLYSKGIQPIWLKVENNDEDPVWILPVGIDPQYYSPIEASLLNHFRYSKIANRSMDRYFYERGKVIRIDPKSVRSGFVFTTLDEGTKDFIVDLIGEDHETRTFTFFINVPGLRVDHHTVEFEEIYSDDEIVSYGEKGFREALEHLPCCTTNKKGTNYGDPLNLVVVGNAEDVFHAFIRSGWDETETVYAISGWKMALSFLFGGEYRYSPVSALYVYSRSQDIALQKVRESIHERNHLRLWLAPMRYEGKPVWIGQISRDIGVKWTLKGGVILTHKIDPDVDEARDYLNQDLWYSQGLVKFAFVKGTGAAPITEPRQNLMDDPYFTDGLRSVLWVSSEPIEFEDVEFIKWETPHKR